MFRKPQRHIATFFLLDGIGFGVWAAHVPVLQKNLRLDTAGLSFVLLSVVLGSLVSMPLTGIFITRAGSATVVRTSATAYIASIAAVGLAPSYAVMIAAAAFFGAAKGALDVSVNAQALSVEKHTGKPCMSFCQGCWSVGGLLGSAASSILLGRSFSARFDLTSTAAFLALLAASGYAGLVADPLVQRENTTGKRIDGYLMKLAVLAFFGLFAEGAVGDWAAVYLHSNVGASVSIAAAGFSAYAICMAASRFAGAWITQRVPDNTLLSSSGLLAAIGFSMLLLAHAWPIGFLGLALTGMGMANIVPVIMNASGRSTTMPTGTAISTVSTIGYFGFLAGPPLIGWVAHATTLQLALCLVVLAGLIVAAGPRLIGRNA